MKQLMTGNEAVASAIIDAGCRYASAYPGTPSTEILETLAQHKNEIYAEWAPNEKTALEGVFGASIAGVRSAAMMKHVGLNVAADPLFTIASVGVTKGLVIITADEPGVHSSQNEQDNRMYAYHANIPLFEPSDSQECYDMIREAFEVSEKFSTPLLIRMTTRVCHSKSQVELRKKTVYSYEPYEKNLKKYVAVPANAKVHKVNVLKREKKLSEYSETSGFNYMEYNDTSLGIVASGICYEYAKEVFSDKASYFKAGFTHPLPIKQIAEFVSKVDKLYVIEENDPIMENAIKAAGINITGKDVFPANDELTPDVIRKAFYGKDLSSEEMKLDDVPPRAPALCVGCPHRGLFYVLAKQKNVYISGDIGCYSLGFAPPYNAMHSIICMGASISAAHGAQKAFDIKSEDTRAIAVIGDSTFFHTGMNSLVNVVYNNSKVITIILDNRITGMTGHQDNPGSGYTAQQDEANIIKIPELVSAIGVKNIIQVDPNDLKSVEEAIKKAYAFDGPSVIITRYPCALKKFSAIDKNEFSELFTKKYYVDDEKCIGCKKCLDCGCPALSYKAKNKKAVIDEQACLGCSVCSQVCPKSAITEAKND